MLAEMANTRALTSLTERDAPSSPGERVLSLRSQRHSRPMRFGPQLGFVQAAVQTLLLDESGVRSDLHDPPFVEYHDPVGVQDGGQPVRDDHIGALSHQ